jgi:transposase
VLGALRFLSRLERATEAMRAALNVLAEVAPEWVREQVDLEWFERYSRRIEDYRLPKDKEARIEYLKTVGTDDIRLLAKLDDPEAAPRSLKQLPEEVEILHRIWEQQYVEIEGGVRVLDPKEMLEAARRVESPYETDARYSTKGAMSWVGYPTVLQWIRKR